MFAAINADKSWDFYFEYQNIFVTWSALDAYQWHTLQDITARNGTKR